MPREAVSGNDSMDFGPSSATPYYVQRYPPACAHPATQPNRNPYSHPYAYPYPYLYQRVQHQQQCHRAAPSTTGANSASNRHAYTPSLPEHHRNPPQPQPHPHPHPYPHPSHVRTLPPLPSSTPPPHPAPSTSGIRRSMPVKLEGIFGQTQTQKQTQKRIQRWMYGEVEVKHERILGWWEWEGTGTEWRRKWAAR